MTTITDDLDHEFWCQPTGGRDVVRIETFTVPRYGEDGITRTGTVRCTRCQECGAARYSGG